MSYKKKISMMRQRFTVAGGQGSWSLCSRAKTQEPSKPDGASYLLLVLE